MEDFSGFIAGVFFTALFMFAFWLVGTDPVQKNVDGSCYIRTHGANYLLQSCEPVELGTAIVPKK